MKWLLSIGSDRGLSAAVLRLPDEAGDFGFAALRGKGQRGLAFASGVDIGAFGEERANQFGGYIVAIRRVHERRVAPVISGIDVCSFLEQQLDGFEVPAVGGVG